MVPSAKKEEENEKEEEESEDEDEEIELSGASMNEAESTYDQMFLSFLYRDSMTRPETPDFDFPKDAAGRKARLKQYMLEAIEEEDLRKLHQLIDIADACGLDKVAICVCVAFIEMCAE